MIVMDTILVVNAGSSSVKFQVFSVDRDGRLQRQIKGQIDGIGSRPRLRASGAGGETLADRAYPIENVADVPAALQVGSDWLRDELGISKFIWGDACITMGREQAAIAIAIVSTKPLGHFRGSPGAYFHGMVSRAKSGQLHLARTIWGMRSHNERQHR